MISFFAVGVVGVSAGLAGPPLTPLTVDCDWRRPTMELTPLGDHTSHPNGAGAAGVPREPGKRH